MKKHEKKDKHHKKEKERAKGHKEKKHDPAPKAKKMAGKGKVEKVMHEYKHKELHSGSKKGPLVHNPKQAIAIALSEARKAGAKIKKARP